MSAALLQEACFMKVFTVAFSIEGDQNIMKGDAIEHEGRLWLVVQWLEHRTEGFAKPRRLIALDAFGLERFPQPTHFGDAAASTPIPKGLLEFPIAPQLAGRFDVLEQPDVTLPSSAVHRTMH
jgi:hypothetical protein